jgi:hypothetical protein
MTLSVALRVTMAQYVQMGHFVYGANAKYEFSDRTLAHVKVAAGLKLRRQESFYLSWVKPASEGSGRVTVWLSPSIPVQFQFTTQHPEDLNRVWLKALAMTAMSDRGMVVLEEQEVAAYVRDNPPTLSTG